MTPLATIQQREIKEKIAKLKRETKPSKRQRQEEAIQIGVCEQYNGWGFRLCENSDVISISPYYYLIRNIVNSVSEKSGVPIEALLSQKRSQKYARPRFIIYYLSRNLTKLSLPAIGRAIDRDHTSVMHGIERAEYLLENDQAFRALYRSIVEQLEI